MVVAETQHLPRRPRAGPRVRRTCAPSWIRRRGDEKACEKKTSLTTCTSSRMLVVFLWIILRVGAMYQNATEVKLLAFLEGHVLNSTSNLFISNVMVKLSYFHFDGEHRDWKFRSVLTSSRGKFRFVLPQLNGRLCLEKMSLAFFHPLFRKKYLTVRVGTTNVKINGKWKLTKAVGKRREIYNFRVMLHQSSDPKSNFDQEQAPAFSQDDLVSSEPVRSFFSPSFERSQKPQRRKVNLMMLVLLLIVADVCLLWRINKSHLKYVLNNEPAEALEGRTLSKAGHGISSDLSLIPTRTAEQSLAVALESLRQKVQSTGKAAAIHIQNGLHGVQFKDVCLADFKAQAAHHHTAA